MKVENLLALALANLPVLLSVLAALGLWKLGAALIRGVVAKAKALAASTPNHVDDAIVAVVGAQLEEVAKLLDAGQPDEAKRKLGIVRLQAKQLPSVRLAPK